MAEMEKLGGASELPVGTAEIRVEFSRRRETALKEEGFASWAEIMEKEISQGILPEISPREGEIVTGRFPTNLSELQPAQPERTTESPIMVAIREDLRNVFGENVDEAIGRLVDEKLVPLRGSEVTEKSVKYLRMAAENVLRDIVAVARAFKLKGVGVKMQFGALSNLSISCFTRGVKGEARGAGFCTGEMHREHIWHVRGVRDFPPGGLKAIGELVDELLKRSAPPRLLKPNEKAFDSYSFSSGV